jgi:hypothetical protein
MPRMNFALDIPFIEHGFQPTGKRRERLNPESFGHKAIGNSATITVPALLKEA